MKFKTRSNLIIMILVTLILFINTLVISLFVIQNLKKYADKVSLSIETQRMMAIENIYNNLVVMTQKTMINQDVVESLQIDFSSISTSDINDTNNKISKVMNNFFYTDFFYQNDFIHAVTLFSFNNNEIYYKQRSGRAFLSTQFDQSDWYKNILESEGKYELFFPLKKEDLYQNDTTKILSVGRLLINPKTNQPMGIIRIDISSLIFEKYLNRINTFTDDNNVILLDIDNELMFTTFSNNKWKEITNQKHHNSDIITTEVISEKYGFKLTNYTNISTIYRTIPLAILIIFLLSMICVFIAFLFSKRTTKIMLEPIQELNKSMQKVRKGDLSVRIPINQKKGEFEEVLNNFNLMVADTEKLLALVKSEESEKQMLEYKALQSQITPHFISNTISTIRWMAYMDGNNDVEQALDSFYHILNFAAREQREKIPIKVELNQMSYYMNIISLRYFDKFVLSYDVEESVKEYSTIKYLLQTLVENSIFHGLKNTTSTATIFISIRLINDSVIYKITDNGIGMSQEKIKSILSGEHKNNLSNGIGIYNINRRIKLIFGEKYGISIKSEEKKYTIVTVTLPAERMLENENSSS